MKPNRFIANSDYLALAETGKTAQHIQFTPVAHDVAYYDPRDPTYVLFSPVGRVVKTISAPAVKGAIEQVQVTYLGVTYAGNEFFNPISRDESWIVQVARIDANTINVTLGHWTNDFVKTSIDDPPYTPEVEFDIAIATFRPPNTT